jgi:ABC-type sugar transport system permease subunit
MERARRRMAWLFLLPTLVLLAAVAGWPLLRTGWLAFTDAHLARPGETQWVGLENYGWLLTDPDWWRAVANTLVFTVISVSAQLLLGLGIALVLAAQFRGRGLLRAAVLIPWAIPTVVSAQMWAWMYNDVYGVFNALLVGLGVLSEPVPWLAEPVTAMAAVIFTDTWKATPFMALLLLAGLQTIPGEVYELRDDQQQPRHGHHGGLRAPATDRLPGDRLRRHRLHADFRHHRAGHGGLHGADAGGPGGGTMRRGRLGQFVFCAAVALILLYTLFPVYWAVVTSLKRGAALFEVEFLPRAPSPENYLAVFTEQDFGANLLNSVLVATSTVAVALVTVAYTLFTLPFTVWVLTAFMAGMPGEMEEAARVDGASTATIVLRIFLPLLAPGLVTTGLLAFIAAWNEFLFALTFTLTNDARTVPVAIALITGASQYELPWGRIMAASVIVTVPLVLLVLFFQHRIVSGLTMGAVKG